MPDDKLLTITVAAKRLGIHYQTLRAWADAGKIPVVRLPSGYRRFDPAVIERMRTEMGYPDDGRQEPAAEPCSRSAPTGWRPWDCDGCDVHTVRPSWDTRSPACPRCGMPMRSGADDPERP